MKINKNLLKRVKNPGVSLLISLVTSTLVLMGAMYTILSVKESLENSENIERSTQLFFAAESGIEAAFFHHNARGAGTTLTDSSQTIEHPDTSVRNTWELHGRTQLKNDNSDYSLMGLLKEGQSIQIPLYWDASTNPTADPSTDDLGTEDITFVFHDESADLTDGDSKDEFLVKNGTVPSILIDFGSAATEVLIDWSFARTHSVDGIQTFSPTENSDCSNTDIGFICEDQLISDPEIASDDNTIAGRILPGDTDTNLDDFFHTCPGGTCSDFVLNFRSLLRYEQSDSEQKIAGIPFEVYTTGNSEFPESTYTVSSNVEQNEFSQSIEIEVPERTSIGAFNYVIFD